MMRNVEFIRICDGDKEFIRIYDEDKEFITICDGDKEFIRIDLLHLKYFIRVHNYGAY
jgi:hypothetical protein